MTNKLWFMKFDTGRWLKDPSLSKCTPATRGIWIDAIAAMHEDSASGTLVGSPAQLARICRCSESDLMAALTDLQSTGTAEVTQRNNLITLENRKMRREANNRENNRLRQRRWKSNAKSNAPITPYMLEVRSNNTPKPPQGGEDFKQFWDLYPRRVAKADALKAWAKLKPDSTLLAKILEAVRQQARQPDWLKADGAYVPYPASWLNGRRWEDEPKPTASPNGNRPADEPGSEPEYKLVTLTDGRRVAVRR